MQAQVKLSDLRKIFKISLLTAGKWLQDIMVVARLETKLAAMSLLTIAVLFLVSIILCFAVWLALLIGLAILLLDLGYSWPWVLLQITGFNLVLLGITLLIMRRCFKDLFFSATRRQFKKNTLTTTGDSYAAQSEETNPAA